MERHLIPAVAILFIAAPLAPAQDSESYAERSEFDPEAGEWIYIAPPIPGTEDGDLELARSTLARGEYKTARKMFKQWFKDFPESNRWQEALFYAADTEYSAENAKPRDGDLMKAYRWYEELIEGWAGTELANRAMRRELLIAEMFLFKKRKQRVWGGVLWLSATDEALIMLDRIIDEWAPNTDIAERALRIKADYHFNAGEFEEAELAYARLARDYPRGQYHRVAMRRSGESALARFPGVEFDDADLLEAEVYFQDFLRRYPTYAADAQVPQTLARIKESRAQKDYTIGRYYERIGKIDAAAYYFRVILEKWPATTWAVKANQRLIALGAIEEEFYEEMGYDESGNDLVEEPGAHND